MELRNTPGRLLYLLPSHWRKPSRNSTRTKLSEWAGAARFERFRAQTFPHLDAIYSDALCLMGGPEAAADLVVETYIRAFESYPQFQRRRVPKSLRTQSTLTWLYGKMHDAFCDEILARAGCGRTPDDRTLESKTLAGGRP